MSKLFVFGIGGTGARVLRSLTLLLASGVKCEDTIIPILIDPDTNNGDLTRTVTLLQRYNSIRTNLNFDASVKNEFFKTEIKETCNYKLPIKNTNNLEFRQFIDIENMTDSSKALMKMLFSENNLASDMIVGFKGNPNIGSVVLNQFSDTQEFINLANDFSAGDRIFIISSIFGGTGASGFPLLLKTLRTNSTLPNFALLNNAPIGAITVLPYFKVEQDGTSSIESDTFISKTKSALSYYDKNIQGEVDVLYYIGDNTTSQKAYENEEGGNLQKNNAHFIEMISALAVIDFANSNAARGTTTFKEFGIENEDTKEIIFSDFAERTRETIRKPMSQFMLFHQYLKHVRLDTRLKQQWCVDCGFERKFFSSDFINDLNFIFEDYSQWLKEMEDNQISFAPFSKNSDKPFEMIKGVEQSNSLFSLFGKKNYELIDQKLNDNHNKSSKGVGKSQLFMELFFNTTSKLAEQKLNM